MSTTQRIESNVSSHGYEALDSGSYTAERLKHATPEHLHLTTRRFFIGPIPEGWLNSHRKAWYQRRLELTTYSSRRATFTAAEISAHQRTGQLTGDTPSSLAIFGQSFPQPEDIHDPAPQDDEVTSDEGDEDVAPTALEPVDTEHEQLPALLGIADPNDPSAPKQIPAPVDNAFPSIQQGPEAAEASPKSPAKNTFLTANETFSQEAHDRTPGVSVERTSTPQQEERQVQTNGTVENRNSSSLGQETSRSSTLGNGNGAESTASLLQHQSTEVKSKKSKKSLLQHEPSPVVDIAGEASPQEVRRHNHHHHRSSTGVRFDISENVAHHREQIKRNVAGKYDRATAKAARRDTLREGTMIKMEKMLVRSEYTVNDVDRDFDENASLRIESKLLDKWREFMVVVRKNDQDEADFRLQMYKTRVIPDVEDERVKKKCTHEIKLNPKNTRVNLYSSLDRTICIWHPYRKGTRIFVMRTRAAAHSVEWYTFLRDALGWHRPNTLQINVPDLSLSLRLEKPFEELENRREHIRNLNVEDAAYLRAITEEQAVAGKMIRKCLEMLQGDPEWADVLDRWSHTEKMGLAWKRYDRLEWVHGANEQKMYGSMAMQHSHELELRPKEHYPTSVADMSGNPLHEPEPVEGFLIRLTSQKGVHQRMGRMFFKRLYFTSQNQFLVFCRPAKSTPPHPPRLQTISGSNVPSSGEIVEKSPVMFDVDPFPMEDGDIKWLKSGNKEYVMRHDERACEESLRNLKNLSDCDGYINLCRVVKIRNIHWGASPVDENVDAGPDVDYHEDVSDTRQDDGTTQRFDDERVFELVLNNNLVIRLQAYNAETKNEWIKRLRQLVHYWKLRSAADMELFKATRQSNLDKLSIDEEMEAIVGQFAKKWEVSKSEASPQLYNMCGIACCRSLSMAGQLYRKPRRHGSFVRCNVILSDGKMMIFQGALRTRSGKEVPHIHQERQTALDLRDCYVYSGLLTEEDLLYHNQTFDSNHPGVHALHRVYLEDGWTSSDEDTMTCFVIWHGLRRSFFRANEDTESGGKRQRLKQVSALGVPGRSIVFKCRSRAERDHWVMNIGMEIDRLQQGVDARIEK
ncbi:MAG: hypothetical protein Q9227_009237 [Pyrenula ochraceoflavens]